MRIMKVIQSGLNKLSKGVYVEVIDMALDGDGEMVVRVSDENGDIHSIWKGSLMIPSLKELNQRGQNIEEC